MMSRRISRSSLIVNLFQRQDTSSGVPLKHPREPETVTRRYLDPHTGRFSTRGRRVLRSKRLSDGRSRCAAAITVSYSPTAWAGTTTSVVPPTVINARVLLGSVQNGRLEHRGLVHFGVGQRLADALKGNGLVRSTSPFTERIRERGVIWLEPKLVAEVGYAEIMHGGALRAAVFRGFV